MATARKQVQRKDLTDEQWAAVDRLFAYLYELKPILEQRAAAEKQGRVVGA